MQVDKKSSGTGDLNKGRSTKGQEGSQGRPDVILAGKVSEAVKLTLLDGVRGVSVPVWQ
jgi:hypothetical protein